MHAFPVQTNWWLEVKWPSGTPGTVPVGDASHRPGLDVFFPTEYHIFLLREYWALLRCLIFPVTEILKSISTNPVICKCHCVTKGTCLKSQRWRSYKRIEAKHLKIRLSKNLHAAQVLGDTPTHTYTVNTFLLVQD